MTGTIDTTRTAAPTAFELLRSRLGPRPLAPLDPVEYAAGHALFESRSDQRGRIGDWFVGHLEQRGDRPSRVLSIGCGDGSMDVVVATALAAGGHRVDYTGVEPHWPSGRAFLTRLTEVRDVHPVVLTSPFAQAHPAGGYDLVLAVHSLYYVTDLAETLRRARGLLAPGGELIVLHAPIEPVNAFVGLLAPGRRQRFADAVGTELGRQGGAATRRTRIESRLCLTATGDPRSDLRLISFTVQAMVPATLERAVRAALAERSEPEPGLVLPHPVDAFVVPA